MKALLPVVLHLQTHYLASAILMELADALNNSVLIAFHAIHATIDKGAQDLVVQPTLPLLLSHRISSSQTQIIAPVFK